MEKGKYRHEIKHLINYSDYLQIKNRIKQIALLDKSAKSENGRYKIRSIYFDNIYDKALMEKLEGINKREKYRIRFYNDDASFIRLEKKSKNHGLCMKQSSVISREQCEKIIDGDLDWIKEIDDAILNEFYYKSKFQLLKPMTIVDYVREAYIYKYGNVRITFDMEVKSGIYSKDIFNSNLPTIKPIQNNLIILEVKYDEFLPETIWNVIQTNNREATAISKYAVCRNFG